MPTIKAIIYDLDGLLLDTEKHYKAAMTQVAGKSVPDSLRVQMLSKKPLEAAKIFVEGMKLQMTPEAYLEKRQPILEQLFRESELMPGVKSLLRHFHEYRIPQAIATSSTAENLQWKISSYRSLFNIFTCTITSDHISKSKPNPETFEVAATCMKMAPENCLVFEDTPSGVAAARSAKMNVIAVPHPLFKKNDFAKAGQVIKSIEEFDPEKWGLPPIKF